MWRMPETPRWLIKRGREDDAREVLAQTREESEVDEEIKEIREVEEAESGGGGLRAAFAPWVRPALLVAIGLAVFQQLVGINTIIYFAPTTLTNVGFGDSGAIYANLVIGVLNVVATVVAVRIVDRVGRKPLLLAGLAGMVTSLTVLGLSNLLMAEPELRRRPAGHRHAGLPGRLHRLVRRHLGTGRVGHAARGAAAERARLGDGRGHLPALGGQLPGGPDVPDPAGQVRGRPGVPGLRGHRA